MNSMATSTHNEAQILDEHGLASVTFTVKWSDERASHEDQLHVEKFSVWREADILPPAIGQNIPGMRAGEQAQAEIRPGAVIDAWQPGRQIATKPARFNRHHRRGLQVQPRVGRFYPQGFFQGVHGIFKDALEPSRITTLTQEQLELDLNHPLARFPLQLQFQLEQVLPGYDRRGGRCISPLDDLLLHPGFAAPQTDGRATDYGDDPDGMSRMDERPDPAFYTKPRLVQHLDKRALETVNSLYRRLVPAQAEVLDLMASYDSHLQHLFPIKLHLLGMNAEEMAANRTAHNWVVQDLNTSPSLRYENDCFDALVCTASIEYLTQPGRVLAETLRVLRPGGLMIITFSNRWFPSKAIRIWSELHEFERVGMVTQWLQQAGFTNLNTFSSRGWPRPADDPHAGQTAFSDPVYAVWGFKPGGRLLHRRC